VNVDNHVRFTLLNILNAESAKEARRRAKEVQEEENKQKKLKPLCRKAFAFLCASFARLRVQGV
jgi:hypothetical protein